MSKTKIAGYLMLAVVTLKVAIDVIDGGAFNWPLHLDELYAALGAAGLIFLRDAVGKVSGSDPQMLNK